MAFSLAFSVCSGSSRLLLLQHHVVRPRLSLVDRPFRVSVCRGRSMAMCVSQQNGAEAVNQEGRSADGIKASTGDGEDDRTLDSISKASAENLSSEYPTEDLDAAVVSKSSYFEVEQPDAGDGQATDIGDTGVEHEKSVGDRVFQEEITTESLETMDLTSDIDLSESDSSVASIEGVIETDGTEDDDMSSGILEQSKMDDLVEDIHAGANDLTKDERDSGQSNDTSTAAGDDETSLDMNKEGLEEDHNSDQILELQIQDDRKEQEFWESDNDEVAGEDENDDKEGEDDDEEDEDDDEDDEDDDDDEDDEEDERDAADASPSGRVQEKIPKKLVSGAYVVVSGPKGFWGRVCSGCGAVIGNVEGASKNEAKMMTGSMKDLKLKWQKVSRTTDITRKATCTRCRLLEKGDIRAALRALDDVDPNVFKNQLRLLKARQVIVLKVIDGLDFDGSWVNSLRDLIGGNPVVIAVTKMDLVVDPDDAVGRERVMAWINRRISMKGIRPTASFAVSGKLGLGVDDLADYILEQLNGRNLYVVGYANSGKSTLVNQLKVGFAQRAYFVGPKGYGRKKDLERATATVSRLPGTTLKSIRIPCFKSHKHAMWDTPGIIIPRYRFAGLEDARIKMISEEPSRINPVFFRVFPGDVIIIGENYMQIDIEPLDGGPTGRTGAVEFRWFSALCQDAVLLPESEASERYPREHPSDIDNKTVPRLAKEFVPTASVRGGVDADVVVQNLGFMAIWSRYQNFNVRIYVPRGVNPTVRPSMPIPDYTRNPKPKRDAEDYNVEREGGWLDSSSRTDKGKARRESVAGKDGPDDEDFPMDFEDDDDDDDNDDGSSFSRRRRTSGSVADPMRRQSVGRGRGGSDPMRGDRRGNERMRGDRRETDGLRSGQRGKDAMRGDGRGQRSSAMNDIFDEDEDDDFDIFAEPNARNVGRKGRELDGERRPRGQGGQGSRGIQGIEDDLDRELGAMGSDFDFNFDLDDDEDDLDGNLEPRTGTRDPNWSSFFEDEDASGAFTYEEPVKMRKTPASRRGDTRDVRGRRRSDNDDDFIDFDNEDPELMSLDDENDDEDVFTLDLDQYEKRVKAPPSREVFSRGFKPTSSVSNSSAKRTTKGTQRSPGNADEPAEDDLDDFFFGGALGDDDEDMFGVDMQQSRRGSERKNPNSKTPKNRQLTSEIGLEDLGFGGDEDEDDFWSSQKGPKGQRGREPSAANGRRSARSVDNARRRDARTSKAAPFDDNDDFSGGPATADNDDFFGGSATADEDNFFGGAAAVDDDDFWNMESGANDARSSPDPKSQRRGDDFRSGRSRGQPLERGNSSNFRGGDRRGSRDTNESRRGSTSNDRNRREANSVFDADRFGGNDRNSRNRGQRGGRNGRNDSRPLDAPRKTGPARDTAAGGDLDFFGIDFDNVDDDMEDFFGSGSPRDRENKETRGGRRNRDRSDSNEGNLEDADFWSSLNSPDVLNDLPSDRRGRGGDNRRSGGGRGQGRGSSYRNSSSTNERNRSAESSSRAPGDNFFDLDNAGSSRSNRFEGRGRGRGSGRSPRGGDEFQSNLRKDTQSGGNFFDDDDFDPFAARDMGTPGRGRRETRGRGRTNSDESDEGGDLGEDDFWSSRKSNAGSRPTNRADQPRSDPARPSRDPARDFLPEDDLFAGLDDLQDPVKENGTNDSFRKGTGRGNQENDSDDDFLSSFFDQ